MNANTLWLVMGWTMLHFLWIGTVIGLSGAIVMHTIRRATSEARYGTALLILFLLALAPLVIAWRLVANASPTTPDQSVSAFTATLEVAPTPGAGHVPGFTMLLTDGGSTFDSKQSGSSIRDVSIPAPHSRSQLLDLAAVWLPWVWVAGSPLTFLWLACGLLGAERLRHQSRRLGDRSCTETCARLCQSMRITRPVDLAACDRLVTPVLVGVIRPLILLPAAAMTGWSAEQFEMVLLHELAHVRRWDNLVNLIQRLVESVLFFHPMVWIVSGWVRKERVHCCDGIVVRQTGKARVYVETLLTLSTTAAGPLPQIAVAMARGHLVARVRRILELGADRHPMMLPRGSLVLIGVLLIMPVGLVLSRAQQAGPRPAAETRTGRVEPADLVTQALELVEAVVPVRGAEGWTIHPIVDIAAARARMGDRAGSATAFDEALKRAHAIASPVFRASQIRDVALGLARAGEAEKSLELAMEQEENVEGFDPVFRSHLLSEIAAELARAGKLKLASRAVERVSDSSARNDALAEIALAQARQSDLTSSLQSVDKINDPGMRVRALAGPLWDGAGIAWIRDSAGDKKGAKLAFNKAISIMSTMPQSEEREYAAASLAIARARLGDVSGGLEQAKGLKEERARSLAQGAIAQILAANGDWDAALQTANAVDDPPLKARALCQIGNAQTRAGKRDAALETLQKALDANSRHNGIEDYSIAIGLARAGDIKAALTIVDAMAARDQRPNPVLLADLAAIEAQAGDFPAARAIAGMIADPGEAGAAWGKIARAQAEAGHEAEAQLWAEALKDPLHRSRALLGVAEGLAARRQRESQEKKPDQAEPPKDKAPQKHQAQVQGKAVDDWIIALKDPNTAIRKQAAELLTAYVETQAGKLSTETKLHDALMNARYSDKDAAVRAAAGVGYQLIYFDPKSRNKTRAHVESQFREKLREETAHVADTEPTTRPSLRGGSAMAHDLAFSPDGRWLATAHWYTTGPGELKLWNSTTHELDATLIVPKTLSTELGLWAIAFSSDSKTIAGSLGRYDNHQAPGAIVLWDIATRQAVHILQGHGGMVFTLAFSPDDKTLASGSNDRTVRFWDVISGRETGRIEGNSGRVLSLAYSPDGRRLAVAGGNSTRLWNLDEPLRRTMLEPASERFDAESLAFSPDGSIIAVAGTTFDENGQYIQGEVRFYDPVTGHRSRVLPFGPSRTENKGVAVNANDLVFSPDGSWLAAVGFHPQGIIWDVKTRIMHSTFEHEHVISSMNSIGVSPDGSRVAVGGGPWPVTVVEVGKPK